MPSPYEALTLLNLAYERAGGSVTGFELIPRIALEFAVKHAPMCRDPLASQHRWYVLMELSSQARDGLRAIIEDILATGAERNLIEDATIAESLDQTKALWLLRHHIADTQKYEGGSIKQDVSVPVNAVPDFIAEATAKVEAMIPGCRPVPFGHLGDGNIHYNVSQPVGADKAEFLKHWDEVNDAVFGVVAKHAGSISAEHGIGVMKRALLPLGEGPGRLRPDVRPQAHAGSEGHSQSGQGPLNDARSPATTASIDAGAVLRTGRRPEIVTALCVGLLVFLLYHLTRFSLSTVWPLVPRGDAWIIYDSSRTVFAASDYPARLALGNMNAVFPYSPSAVILFRGLTAAGPAIFMATWLLMMAAGLLTSIRASVAQEERSELAGNWLLIGAIALVFASAPVTWDLRNANSNLIYLGVVLAGYALMDRRPLLAGALVALSISLKLYSGLLMLWLMLNGPRRAFYSCVAASVALWIVLPVVFFGIEGAVQIYWGWYEQVRIVGDPWVYTMLAENRGGPPIITLRKAVMFLTGEAADATRTQIYVLDALVGLGRGIGLVCVARRLRGARRHPVARCAFGLDGAPACTASFQPMARALSRHSAAARRNPVRDHRSR